MKSLFEDENVSINFFNYFDAEYYIHAYPDVKDPIEDYLKTGWKMGRNPNRFFDVVYYLESNPDVKEAQLEPLAHYLSFGWREGRNPSIGFNVRYYLESNPDVRDANMEPLYHYMKFGHIEGRVSVPPIDENAIGEKAEITVVDFEKNNYDVPIVNGKPAEEIIIANSEFFDAKWYASNYKLKPSQDPAKHYLEIGWKEMYNPSDKFSTVQYLLLNSDVENLNTNPLLHYELYGRNEQNRIYHEPHVIDQTLNIEYKRKQDKYISSTYSKEVKKLIVYLVPELDLISGGVMSISSMARVTKDIEELSGYEVLIATMPSITTFFKYSKFDSGFNVLRFDQLREYFSKLEEVIIHIPEIYVYYFMLKIKPIDADWLRGLKKAQINIMNQNMILMPRPRVVDYLKKIGHTITMTCAHKRYCTKQLRSSYDTPVHFFSTSNLVKYKYRSYKEKENIIVYSPDDNTFRHDVISLLKKNFPKYEFLEIKNMSYTQYLDTITRAKWMITFGEGIDGYFVESIRSGTIPFSVRNFLFFDEDYNGYSNIYDSYFDMLGKIVEDMKRLDEAKKYDEFNGTLRELDARIYNDKEYKENIKNYYLNKYTFPIEKVIQSRKARVKKKPGISIVMATYNGEEYIEKQLDSLIAQTYSNFEIIISDDGSTDSTLKILNRYKEKYGVTVLSNKKNKGLVGNFSNGLMVAKGEYIALCDQDDIWEKNKLEVLLERMDDFDIVQGQMVIIDDTDAYHPAKYMHDAYETNKTSLYSIENYIKENPMLGCATLITRSCIEKSLPVPNGFVYHDWWIALNAILRGNGICNIDIPVVKYRQHDLNTAKSNFWSSEWCEKKHTSDGIILKDLSDYLTPTAKNLIECDMNLMLLYGFARKYAPKMAFDYFESNAVAFTDQVMQKLIESISTKVNQDASL